MLIFSLFNHEKVHLIFHHFLDHLNRVFISLILLSSFNICKNKKLTLSFGHLHFSLIFWFHEHLILSINFFIAKHFSSDLLIISLFSNHKLDNFCLSFELSMWEKSFHSSFALNFRAFASFFVHSLFILCSFFVYSFFTVQT
jgi:hypothetical protein